MKKMVLLCIAAALLIVASFFLGRTIESKEHRAEEISRCDHLITTALYKVENGDLTDESTVKALLSDLYAAYEVTDDPYTQEILHEIWNTLLFDSEAYAGKEDVLAERLRSAYHIER